MISSDYVTLGGGKFYIDVYKDGKPSGKFEYFGLTTAPTISTDVETLEHINTEGATQAVDKTIVKKQSATLNFTSDEISMQMLSRAFYGEVGQSETSISKSISGGVSKGDIVDLGVFGGSCEIDGLNENEDFTYNAKGGFVEFLKDISDDIEISVSGGASNDFVSAFKTSKLEASLMFIGESATGSRIKADFYKCSIRQNGEFALKGDDWLSVSFTADVLKDESRSVGDQFFKITLLENK